MTDFEAITLSSERLRLRFMTEADAAALFDIFSNAEVMRYWAWPAWTELAQAHQWVRNCLEGYRTRSAYKFGIERCADNMLVGICTLFNFHADSRRAETGYALGRPYWGWGYMHEALGTLLDFGFHTLDLNRVEADIDPRNLASARTLVRLGFQKEGHLRERWIVNGEVSDTWWYGLLRREWDAHVRIVK